MKKLVFLTAITVLLFSSCAEEPTTELTDEQDTGFENPKVPSARMYHSLVYHDKTDCFLLFAGFTKHGWIADLRDMWKYDPKINQWEMIGICEAVAADGSSGITSVAYDNESDQFITLDRVGRTWAYNYETALWKNMNPSISPHARCGEGLEYDQESDRIIMFGGFGCKDVNDTVFSDTWAYDYNSNSWTKLNPEISPSERMYPAITYDQSNDKIILWGGRKKDPIHDNKIWTYDFNNDVWQSLENIGGPEKPLTYASMVYRNKTKDIILFGGAILESIDTGTPLNSTWSYSLNQNKWTDLSPKTSPPPVSNHSMSFDTVRNTILMFGGELQELYSNIVSRETWIYDSEQNTWIKK
jgi:N-acetylneuraminic acid mutarotase